MREIALTARLLGTLFYYAPDDERNREIVTTFRIADWQHDWPCGDPLEIEQAAALIGSGLADPERVKASWQRLFIGPDPFKAPAWGSVYLDRESVLFGDSTLSLRHWMKSRGISPDLPSPEPEDHFGLLLLLTAWCAEQQPEWLDELLPQHILPWAGRYLELLSRQEQEVFYPGLALLALSTLKEWVRRGEWEIAAVELYF